VLVTYGYTSVLVRYLRERGIDADVVATRYEGERDEKGTEELEAVEEPPTAGDAS
jgi:putative mRNA 3-end processing factor